MGFLSGLKNAHHQTTATTYVQSLLRHQVKSGSIRQDPLELGAKLVDYQWEELPEVFNGESGPRPLKATTAASALASGLYLLDKSEPDRVGVTIALGLVLQRIALGKAGHEFNQIDLELIADSTIMFKDAVEEMDDDIVIADTWIKRELQVLTIPIV